MVLLFSLMAFLAASRCCPGSSGLSPRMTNLPSPSLPAKLRLRHVGYRFSTTSLGTGDDDQNRPTLLGGRRDLERLVGRLPRPRNRAVDGVPRSIQGSPGLALGSCAKALDRFAHLVLQADGHRDQGPGGRRPVLEHHWYRVQRLAGVVHPQAVLVQHDVRVDPAARPPPRVSRRVLGRGCLGIMSLQQSPVEGRVLRVGEVLEADTRPLGIEHEFGGVPQLPQQLPLAIE